MTNLDDMLTQEEAAAWLKMPLRALALKSRGRKPMIPAFRVGDRSPRYHPRTILAKLAKDAGVPMDLLAASHGITASKQP